MKKNNIAVLGSSGSIGRNTLDVVRRNTGRFRVAALAVNSNTGVLSGQIKEFRPDRVAVMDADKALELEKRSGRGTQVLAGMQGMEQICRDPDIDTVVLAVSGCDALIPLLAALGAGKRVCLANKESLVMAGPLVKAKLAASKAQLIPIDSEQSAIWQCLQGQQRRDLRRIYLTASGGPFRKASRRQLEKITVRQALAHPRWKMGRKITVDSATLMNKGLELLEAMCLFDVSCDEVKVIVHPQAIIHSMVEFCDGSVIAQLSQTDMRIPIQYALSYPQRLDLGLKSVDFVKLGVLSFEEPDMRKFPCLKLAYQAARTAGTMPAVMNAANDAAVDAFLRGKLSFTGIAAAVEKVMRLHRSEAHPKLERIFEVSEWARAKAEALVN